MAGKTKCVNTFQGYSCECKDGMYKVGAGGDWHYQPKLNQTKLNCGAQAGGRGWKEIGGIALMPAVSSAGRLDGVPATIYPPSSSPPLTGHATTLLRVVVPQYVNPMTGEERCEDVNEVGRRGKAGCGVVRESAGCDCRSHIDRRGLASSGTSPATDRCSNNPANSTTTTCTSADCIPTHLALHFNTSPDLTPQPHSPTPSPCNA